MSKKKQTAVDFLIEEIECRGLITKELRIAFEQAKAMQIDQHQTTFNAGYEEHIVETWGEEDPKGFEDYFTETFKID